MEAKRDEALKAVAENTITPEEAEAIQKKADDLAAANTLEQLKELAAARNITADKGWKKADYATAIVAAEAKSA